MTDRTNVLITGATGLAGGRILAELLQQNRSLHAVVLVRSLERWRHAARALGANALRVIPVQGDVALPGLGLDRSTREYLARHVTSILHCAANVSFSQPLEDARATNRDGTAHVLELAAECRHSTHFAHVSTAFVAGTRQGLIRESDTAPGGSAPGDNALSNAALSNGWVNGYEQSKAEAEVLVRTQCSAWTILRLTTVACDDLCGHVTQVNAIHRALRLLHAGLAPMLPGTVDTPIDLTTTEYVARTIAAVMLTMPGANRTLHLCAGEGAMPLGELLDRTYAYWSAHSDWRRRSIAPPVLTDLATYRLFEESVADAGDARLQAITRSLSHFVPQLALPKMFDCSNAAAAGFHAPPVSSFWEPMLEHVLGNRSRIDTSVAA